MTNVFSKLLSCKWNGSCISGPLQCYFICLMENKRRVYPFEGQKIVSVKGARVQEWGLYDIRSLWMYTVSLISLLLGYALLFPSSLTLYPFAMSIFGRIVSCRIYHSLYNCETSFSCTVNNKFHMNLIK